MYSVQMAFYIRKLSILFVYTHENFSETSEKPLPSLEFGKLYALVITKY